MSDELTYDYIREAFEFLPDWESRYEFIEDLGKTLPSMDESLKTDANRVHGCMSLVHVKADVGEDGTVVLHGDCDTSTIKGVVAIVLAIYRGKSASQILQIDADERFEELGLSPVAVKAGPDGSGILSALAAADGLIDLGEDSEGLAKGQTAAYLPFNEVMR